MKRYLATFILGMLGGMVATVILVSRPGSNFLSGLIGKDIFLTPSPGGSPVLSTPTLSPSPAVIEWQNIAAETALKTVAVQSFRGAQLVTSGSGVALSSDGLVMTLADLAPPGLVYQIFLGDQIVRGKLVARDPQKNLALIRIEARPSAVADLEDERYESGLPLLLTGKLVEFSQVQIFSQQALISYAGREIVLDTAPSSFLNGAVALTPKGRIVGLALVRSKKVVLISAQTIRDFWRAAVALKIEPD